MLDLEAIKARLATAPAHADLNARGTPALCWSPWPRWVVRGSDRA